MANLDGGSRAAAYDCPERAVSRQGKLQRSSLRSFGLACGVGPFEKGYGRSCLAQEERPGVSSLWLSSAAVYANLLIFLVLVAFVSRLLATHEECTVFYTFYLLYLYTGSMFVIFVIYVLLIKDSFSKSPRLHRDNPGRNGHSELLSGLQTLSKVHTWKSSFSRAPFPMRMAAIAFWFGCLLFHCLEIAAYVGSDSPCISDTAFSSSVLQIFFLSFQMHFLFINPETVVTRLGDLVQFGYAHMVATNCALCLDQIAWEISRASQQAGGSESTSGGGMAAFRLRAPFGDVPFYLPEPTTAVPTVAPSPPGGGGGHRGNGSSAAAPDAPCYERSALGKMWTRASGIFFPVVTSYNLLTIAIVLNLWLRVERKKRSRMLVESVRSERPRRHSAKAALLGLLVLACGVVLTILHHLKRQYPGEFPNLDVIVRVGKMVFLCATIAAEVAGTFRASGLPALPGRQLPVLDRMLVGVGQCGFHAFAAFSAVPALPELDRLSSILLLLHCALLDVQVAMQVIFTSEASRRDSASSPVGQVALVILFFNATFLLMELFASDADGESLQSHCYGPLVWTVVQKLSFPLMVIFRFHSCFLLFDLWSGRRRRRRRRRRAA